MVDAQLGPLLRRTDDIARQFRASPVTALTTNDHALLYSMGEGVSEFHNLNDQQRQPDYLSRVGK
jgi:hypothetical protein